MQEMLEMLMANRQQYDDATFIVVLKHSWTLKQYNYESIVKYFNEEKPKVIYLGVFIALSVYFFFL
jgi:hypothetical protein